MSGTEGWPAWLVSKVDQRVALMKEKLPTRAVAKADIVMTALNEPPEGATPEEWALWERACDNCGTYCEDGFYTGHVTVEVHGRQAIITFGVCEKCKDLP